MKSTHSERLAWLLVTAPAAALMGGALTAQLGANPVETITHQSGQWALRFMVATLAVTPIRRWLGWNRLAPLRRTLGLAAFFYATVHVMTWAILDWSLEPTGMWSDIADRPFITVGAAAFALMIPLAITSTRGWIRRLGHNWVKLHRLVYPAMALVLIHFFWLIKSRKLAAASEPLIYAAVVTLLLLARIPKRT